MIVIGMKVYIKVPALRMFMYFHLVSGTIASTLQIPFIICEAKYHIPLNIHISRTSQISNTSMFFLVRICLIVNGYTTATTRSKHSVTINQEVNFDVLKSQINRLQPQFHKALSSNPNNWMINILLNGCSIRHVVSDKANVIRIYIYIYIYVKTENGVDDMVKIVKACPKKPTTRGVGVKIFSFF